MIYYALLLRIFASIIVWYKATAKDLFGLDYPPVVWWLTLGFIIEYCYLHSWWMLSKETSAWTTYILLLGVGSITHMALMSFHFGFNLKYIIGCFLIISGVLVSKM